MEVAIVVKYLVVTRTVPSHGHQVHPHVRRTRGEAKRDAGAIVGRLLVEQHELRDALEGVVQQPLEQNLRLVLEQGQDAERGQRTGSQGLAQHPDQIPSDPVARRRVGRSRRATWPTDR